MNNKRKKTVSADERIISKIKQVASERGITNDEAAAMLIRLALEKEARQDGK